MRWRNELLTVALTASVAAVALMPALAQRAPESILPPGFGDTPKPPKPAKPERQAEKPAKPAADKPDKPVASKPADKPADRQASDKPATDRAAADRQSNSSDTGNGSAATASNGDDVPALPYHPTATGGGGEGDETVATSDSADAGNVMDNAIVAAPAPLDLPPAARRSTARIGLIGPEDGGLAPVAFGASAANYLIAIMDSISAPIASRWASIALRRTLVSDVDTPAGADPADWIASRAWLLVRMGEADNARALVARVDSDRFTDRLEDVGLQTALATADPASTCEYADDGGDTAGWILTRAMCSGLSGESGTASAQIEQARRRKHVGGIDVHLAEKVAAVGSNTRRSITIEWTGVPKLTAWRYGLATATGVAIPDNLFATVGPQVRAWHARAPLFAPTTRLFDADQAAVLGVFSNAALADLYSEAYEADDPSKRDSSVAGQLAAAFRGGNAARAGALDVLFRANDPMTHYARLILGARAAALVNPDSAVQNTSDLIASMMTAGYDTRAARWGDKVSTGSLGWALLAVGTPKAPFAISKGNVDSFIGGNDDPGGKRGKFLVAALAGLGRVSAEDASSLAQAQEIPVGRVNGWTQALDRAAAAHEPGTVMLLAAAGLQGKSWADVPPENLFRAIAALRAVGMEPQARMIAAEALTRG